ncbi:hypothetical protein XH92_37690 [Bradyrhizobium sp. CCBAU 53421]|nr:hypothetical protein XH92_37690 [Bradyrhizobium sp. CCBAU 53421]
MVDGRLAKDYWVFTGQTATDAEIDMLERSGVKPSREQPTKVFTLLGVPHTAEERRGLHSSRTFAGSDPLA